MSHGVGSTAGTVTGRGTVAGVATILLPETWGAQLPKLQKLRPVPAAVSGPAVMAGAGGYVRCRLPCPGRRPCPGRQVLRTRGAGVEPVTRGLPPRPGGSAAWARVLIVVLNEFRPRSVAGPELF